MQTNSNTVKTIRKPSKSLFKGVDKYLKGQDKDKTWKRGTDKRSMNFDGLQGGLK